MIVRDFIYLARLPLTHAMPFAMQALRKLRISLRLLPMIVLVMVRKRLRDVIRLMFPSAFGGGAVRDRTWQDGDGDRTWEDGDGDWQTWKMQSWNTHVYAFGADQQTWQTEDAAQAIGVRCQRLRERARARGWGEATSARGGGSRGNERKRAIVPARARARGVRDSMARASAHAVTRQSARAKRAIV